MRVASVLLRHRPLLAGAGLLAFAGLLAVGHRPASTGVAVAVSATVGGLPSVSLTSPSRR